MTGRDGQAIARRFFSGTSASYDRISNLCTFGADRWWKRKMLAKIPSDAATILDQACGTGILSIEIARRFPQSTIVGVDMTEEYLEVARRKAAALKLGNVRFVWGRAEDVDPGRKLRLRHLILPCEICGP